MAGQRGLKLRETGPDAVDLVHQLIESIRRLLGPALLRRVPRGSVPAGHADWGRNNSVCLLNSPIQKNTAVSASG